jgi:hypothetical protein
VTTNGTCGSRDVTEVVLGMDTHLDFHVAVVLDLLGRRLGESKIPTTLKGYRNLLRWAEGFCPVRRTAEGKSKWEIIRCLKL